MSNGRTEREDFRETECARRRALMRQRPSSRSLGALCFPAGLSEASSCSPLWGRIAVCEASSLVLDAGKTFREVLQSWLPSMSSSPTRRDGLDQRGAGLRRADVGPSLSRMGQQTLELRKALAVRGAGQPPVRSRRPKRLRGWRWERTWHGARTDVAPRWLPLHLACSPQAGRAPNVRSSPARHQTNVRNMTNGN
jgi:hypothetical protein